MAFQTTEFATYLAEKVHKFKSNQKRVDEMMYLRYRSPNRPERRKEVQPLTMRLPQDHMQGKAIPVCS